jgi:hypothetical protein
MSNFPTSDITHYQSQIMYPAGVYEHFPVNENGTGGEKSSEEKLHQEVMMAYSGQIWLRVILNEAHNLLYGGSELNSNKLLYIMLTSSRRSQV